MAENLPDSTAALPGKAFLVRLSIGCLVFVLVMGLGTFGIGTLWGRHIKANQPPPPADAKEAAASGKLASPPPSSTK